jgi:hypothetical protein
MRYDLIKTFPASSTQADACRRKIEMSPGVQSRDDIPRARGKGTRSVSLPASRSEVEQRYLIGSLDWIWATIVGDW